MLSIDTISWNDSQNVQDTINWVFENLNVSFRQVMIVDKGVSCFSSKNSLSCFQINIQEMILVKLSLSESGTIDDCKACVSG